MRPVLCMESSLVCARSPCCKVFPALNPTVGNAAGALKCKGAVTPRCPQSLLSPVRLQRHRLLKRGLEAGPPDDLRDAMENNST